MNATQIHFVAVIGAGTMGAGIAVQFARAGCQVRMADKDEDALNRGMSLLRLAQQSLVNAEFLSAEDADASLARITPVLTIEEACADVQLLVEAAPENLPLKQELFARFDAACPKEALLATNTSGLSITKIARATTRPEQVAGMHFWNPPHIIPLVEITKGELTADATAQTLLDVSRRLGKRPILVRHDVPGFVGNRIQFAIMREALHLLADLSDDSRILMSRNQWERSRIGTMQDVIVGAAHSAGLHFDQYIIGSNDGLIDGLHGVGVGTMEHRGFHRAYPFSCC